MAGASDKDVGTPQQAIDLLGPALGIMDSFNHRNKNQHRLSKWWAQFDMLRRGVRKLVADLQTCVEAQTRITSSTSKKKRKVALQKEVDEELQKTGTRARHIHSQLIPRAFLAFTQLAADNQYAHLGLALIGILAQVNAAVTPLSSAQVDDNGIPVVQEETIPPTPMSKTEAHGVADVADLGVSVSREELRRQVIVPEPRVRSTLASADPEENPIHQVHEDLRKRKKRKDEFDDLFDSLQAKDTKKKKKRKKKDEFDDMFSSLV